MGDSKNFRFTPEVLREYSEAALKNASELVEEASLLYAHGHVARAYFLAVASIEETGKALLAFDAQGRNLADSAVTSKLKRAMEDHSQKITEGLYCVDSCKPEPARGSYARGRPHDRPKAWQRALDVYGHSS